MYYYYCVPSWLFLDIQTVSMPPLPLDDSEGGDEYSDDLVDDIINALNPDGTQPIEHDLHSEADELFNHNIDTRIRFRHGASHSDSRSLSSKDNSEDAISRDGREEDNNLSSINDPVPLPSAEIYSQANHNSSNRNHVLPDADSLSTDDCSSQGSHGEEPPWRDITAKEATYRLYEDHHKKQFINWFLTGAWATREVANAKRVRRIFDSRKRQSSVWDEFHQCAETVSGRPFVLCIYCKRTLKHPNATHQNQGTSSMAYHSKKCTGKQQQRDSTGQLQQESTRVRGNTERITVLTVSNPYICNNLRNNQ